MPKSTFALLLSAVIVAAAVTVWAFNSLQGGTIAPISIAIGAVVALVARLVFARKAP